MYCSEWVENSIHVAKNSYHFPTDTIQRVDGCVLSFKHLNTKLIKANH